MCSESWTPLHNTKVQEEEKEEEEEEEEENSCYKFMSLTSGQCSHQVPPLIKLAKKS